MDIPISYISDKIYTYSVNVKETSNYIRGCCPVCREGSSWGQKERMFFFKNESYFYCHNCGGSWTPYMWIKEVTGMTFKEIKNDLIEQNHDVNFRLLVDKSDEKIFELPTFPGECVNLKDQRQVEYFSKDYPVINECIKYCQSRRLFTAINAPKTFYACLNDKFHGNRLIIPYFNNNAVEFYFSRSIMKNDKRAKYLAKFGADKPIFNIDKIDDDFPFIFICEGQIDSMFIKNGVAISGVHLTDKQDFTLTSQFPFHKRIWVLDNYKKEGDEVRKIIIDKINEGETLFFYNDEFSEFKDLNEYCTKKEKDFIDPSLLIKNSFQGNSAKLQL